MSAKRVKRGVASSYTGLSPFFRVFSWHSITACINKLRRLSYFPPKAASAAFNSACSRAASATGTPAAIASQA